MQMSDDAIAASLQPILQPRSIAIIGASRTAGTIGNQILVNLVQCGFTGPVFPVNPRAESVHSVKCYASIGEVPQQVDLAMLAVPSQLVLPAAHDCAKAGVRGLVVISAGFREIGGEGARRESELAQLMRENGIRLVGPNCLGVVNANRNVSMNATFAPGMPPGGDVAFMSQSGALGLSVLDYASELGIGISQFVSLGNKPDVSGNDLLLYWERDATVRVVLMYVEDFGNPQRFLEIARRVSRSKPIIVMKSGRSRAGARAASSHTGSLAASDSAVDAMVAQAGVLRAASIEELFDMAMAFEARSFPTSRRTAVLTNSGGPGIVIADALEAQGMELVELKPATLAKVKQVLPPEASVQNPLDMIATATPAIYRTALAALLDDEHVNSVVAIFVPPLGVKQEDVAEAIVEAAAAAAEKPVVAVLMGRQGLPQGRAELSPAHIPAFIFPESAARALATLVRYREWVERPLEDPPRVEVDRTSAAALLDAARANDRSRLDEIEALDLLATYGIPVARSVLATSAAEAARFVDQLGTAAVLKVVSPQVVHKTDVGGVETGVASAAHATAAWARMIDRVKAAVPDAQIRGVLVQPQIPSGRELILGIVRDPLFGPLVMFGLGGVYVETLRDVIFRIAPLTRGDARDMIRGIKGARILEGVRGQPPVQFAQLEDVLLRLSALATDFPQIAELDVNPLVAFPESLVAVDCRVQLTAGPDAAH
jgi:acetyltransferase